MKIARFNARACEKCAVCNAMLACPTDAISHNWAKDLQHNGPVTVNEKKCIGCGKCELICRGAAIHLEETASQRKTS